ncbi:DNA ligase 1-like [Chenopodium quinoa]|uniref:DNA ligase 1-like n=1 Tax=Chenopodium quinoa TaxID=63459 RepID=UPI000B77EFC5|nr:DNA ligase 1-like [Chenopodium quinoa]
MARCYPYPPPGYAGKCSSHEALILSIKLQKEKEKANANKELEKIISERKKSKSSSDKKKGKEDKKERKRDREDKDKKSKEERKKEKKEKKEKKREKRAKPSDPAAESGKQDFVAKLSKPENVLVEFNGKLQKTNAELLERSSVTEEHGQPIDSHNAPCSSDSTGNSGKRKRSMPSPSGIQSNGNIIRIRLSSSSQKRDETSTSGSKGQEVSQLPQVREDPVLLHSQVRPCDSRATQDASVRQKDVVSEAQSLLPCSTSTSTATLQRVSAEASGLKAEVSQKGILPLLDKVNTLEKLSSHDRRMQKKESTYKQLFVDWVPPALEMVEEDDGDWLFGKKDEDRSAKRLRASNDVQSQVDNLPCSASAVMQPRAQYLANAEIYALPFTVPF